LQQACVRWFNLQYSNLRMLLFAVPNGGKRNSFEAARLQSEGVVAGVSDLILLAPNSRGQILCIEMKVGRGKQTENQKAFQVSVENTGNKYAICSTLDEFIVVVRKHLRE